MFFRGSFAALVLLPGLAAAEPNARAAADALFRDGRAAMARADYATACPLLARSQELDPAGGTLMNLALCHEKQGRLVAALDDWRRAAERSRRERRPEREREALVHLADLEARVPHVTLLAPASAAVITVVLDGKAIPAPTLELPTHLRLDPGTHAVRTETPGREPLIVRFELQERVPFSIELQEPAVALPTAPSAVSVAPLLLASHGALAPRSALPAEPRALLSPPSKVLLGTAAAAGLTAIVSGTLAVAARLSYTSHCIDRRAYCDDLDALATGQRARSMAWVSTVSTTLAFTAVWTALLLPRKPGLTPRTRAALSLRAEF